MINFTHIFQDCWNFMRNQREITLKFTALFFIVSALISFFSSQIQIEMLTPSQAMNVSDAEVVQASKYMLVLVVLPMLLNIFLSAWGISSIHQISQYSEAKLSQSFTIAMKRFLGLVLINILISIPLLISASEILVSIMMHTSPSIFSLIAIVLGTFVFIRFSLLNVHYLIHNQSLSQSIKTMWQSGVKRTAQLFLYTVISYIAFPLLLKQLYLWISGNLLLEIIIDAVSSFVYVFLLIFAYRFYTIFMQQKEQ